MAAGNFPNCNKVTRGYEGGYSNHPSDPGGKTMNGVTETVFQAWLRKNGKPVRPVRTITPTETDAIYKEEYWNSCGAEALFAGVDLAVYDASVNSGVSRGVKWLKSSVGSNDHSVTVKRICAARLSFMKSLKTWATFKNGWSKRVAGIEALGVKWALVAMGLSETAVREKLTTEAKKADTLAKTQGTVAVGSGGAGGTAGVTVSPDQLGSWVLWGVLGLIIVAVVVLALKSKVNNDRKKAYQEQAA